MDRACIAALETDLAQVATATEAVLDLEALALLSLQRGLLDSDAAERVFSALGRLTLGVDAGRKWMAMLRNGQVERGW